MKAAPRISALAAVLLLAPLSLAAQAPAPDAPLARHVDFLVQAADSGFRALKGERARNSGPHASSYRMRFAEMDFAARVQEMGGAPPWAVVHSLKAIPAAGAADSIYRAMLAQLDAAVPTGWAVSVDADGRRQWRECGGEGLHGRVVWLRRVLDERAGGPFVAVDVYRFREPCVRPAPSSAWGSPQS